MSLVKLPSFSNKIPVMMAAIFVAIALFVAVTPLAIAAVDETTGTSNNRSNAGSSTAGGSSSQNPIVHDIQIIVNFLAAGVGIVVVGTIILGAIQYIASGDSPEGVNKAKQRITNGLIALLAFIFMYAFAQWLIPGGVF